MLGVVAHYRDNNHVVQARLIGLRRLRGVHSGENIAETILTLLNEYEITSRISFFTADNAESNDKAINLILQAARPDLSLEQRKQLRLRC
jgi:hypothetical protein